MTKPVLQIDKLYKRFGDFEAVSGINLTVHAGQIYGLLGPNGAGKTTTLRLVTGLLQPTSGQICVAGADLRAAPLDAKQQIGFICDRPYIYEKLTGREFLRFVGGLWRIPPSRIEQNADFWLSQFDLLAWGDQLVEAYSHGMRQRLLFCAALLHEPRLFVLDEPLVGLDPRGAVLLKTILRRLADQGTAVILSTHTLDVVEQVCDAVAIIDRGQVIANGTLGEVARGESGNRKRLEEVFLQLTQAATREPQFEKTSLAASARDHQGE